MKRVFLLIIMCVSVCMSGGCGKTSGARWQYVDTAMGTVIQQSIYASDVEAAQSFSQAVTELLGKLEKEQISWRVETSEVARLNDTAGSGEGFPATRDLADIIKQCMEMTEQSEGAFDVTIGMLARLWDIDSYASGTTEKKFSLPAREAIEQTLSESSEERVRIEKTADGNSCIFLAEGVQIDLGAIGKGLALTEIYELLQSYPEISGAVISAGGSILTCGSKPDGSPWKVAIINPQDTSANIGLLSLKGQWFVATSGDYERYVELDGIRYHHILNPKTGYPAESGVRSVTILSKDGPLSDALSTACFVLGTEKGIALAEKYEAEVLMVTDDGQIAMSEGMKQFFQEN